MIKLDDTHVLFIEPSATTSLLVDSLTRRMVAAWRARRCFDAGFRGFHRCACGAESDNRRHWLMSNGKELETSSLCVHYVAMHRAEIPKSELAKLAGITEEELEPKPVELQGLRHRV